MGFTVQTMLGHQALVSGTDNAGTTGQTVVDTTQWDSLAENKRFSTAVEDFDAAVKEFFAPIMEAADKVEATQTTPDPLGYVVLKEGVEGVKSEPAEIVELTKDSIVLRLIDEGQTDRLVWVSPTELGVLAAS